MRVITKLAGEAVDYEGFGDYSAEMKGYAQGLGIDVGLVVAANLVYQVPGRVDMACVVYTDRVS